MPVYASTVVPAPPPEPEAVFNCPQCSHYLPPGTLACPECHTIIYSGHLRDIAIQATAAENEQRWSDARETWRGALAWLPEGTAQTDAVNAKIGAIDARLRAQNDFQAKWTRRLGPLAPLFFFLLKAKSFLFVLLKMKFLLSLVAFFGIYWALFGLWFGLGFTASILVHEMGHFVAAKRRGLKVDLPVFLPGLGAYVRWYSLGMSLETLSGIALAGPFFGLIFAVVCAGISVATGNPLFAALARVSAWLNVFNLTPVLGLDGAQATYALDRTQRWLILATALILAGLLGEWIFLFIVAGMAFRIFQREQAESPSTRTMVQFILLLFGLGLLLYRFKAPSGSAF